MEPIQIKSHGPTYKTDTKHEAKSLRAITFVIVKVGRAISKWGAMAKIRYGYSNIGINNSLMLFQKIILHFGGTNNISVNFIPLKIIRLS